MDYLWREHEDEAVVIIHLCDSLHGIIGLAVRDDHQDVIHPLPGARLRCEHHLPHHTDRLCRVGGRSPVLRRDDLTCHVLVSPADTQSCSQFAW